MKGKKRHDFFYALLRTVFKRYLTRNFNFQYDKLECSSAPYIVAANHVSNWDPILIGLSFKKPMYYVASDHLLRKAKGRFIQYAISPIPRMKTANETQTVITIFKRLKEKLNICVFVEGTTTFDGVTGEIQPSIGKLVKRAGVTLLTYKFSGTFFTSPRWARFHKKGITQGRLVNTYSPEKIALMSEDEIYNAIKNDIYVNAYNDQERNPAAFKGKKRAEYLETILYCCPECKQIGTLKSRGDTVFCSRLECGFKVHYNERCYFEFPDGNPAPYKTITDWIKWEREELDDLVKKTKDCNTALFSDEDQELIETVKSKENIAVAKGKLCLYKDRLSFTDKSGSLYEFFIKDIIDIGVITRKTLIFAAPNKVYEVHSKNQRSALKYMDIVRKLKFKE
ncbi:MAG: 1-acyl-sn-glycerol-3-phosphate acyltransferase [Treponema sp.]|nr:1-acyl-sn-glycerol-3-phosphate acyltransferase [Treponema sp.]